MGTDTMGKVLVTAKIENLEDQYAVYKGQLAPDQVRTLVVNDAVVDSGAMGLMMPARLIAVLGLRPAVVQRDRRKYGAVRLTVQGRNCVVEVHETADRSRVIIGQLSLTAMDWVVDTKGQRLIGNPAHGGEEMVDVF